MWYGCLLLWKSHFYNPAGYLCLWSQPILSLPTYKPHLCVFYPYGKARLTQGCGWVCFPKIASRLVFTGTYQHGEIHIFGFWSHSASAAYESRIYLQVNLNEPYRDSRGGSVSGQLGGVMWNASPWFHVCILLENCIGNWLCKYLDSQMTWFKLTFTDSPAAAIVILYNGRVNLSITTRKASV